MMTTMMTTMTADKHSLSVRVPAELAQDPNPALAVGLPRDEGVIAAYIPTLDVVPVEHQVDGKIAYEVDGLLLNAPAQKWWKMRQTAHMLDLDPVEPILACAAEDFRISSVLDKQLPRPEGHQLAFRAYSGGPWYTLY